MGRVWLALTDPRLLSQWFGQTTAAVAAGARFRIRPTGPPVLDETIIGEVLEFDEPRRLVMRWSGSDRRTVVACDLTPRPDGCRLAFQEFPEAGTWQPDERHHREAAYQQALQGRLPAVLDWLAFREVEFTTPAERAEPTEGPAPPQPSAPGPGRRRLAIAGACLLVAGVTTTVVLAGRGDGDPGAAPPTFAPSDFVSATPRATSPPARPPARAARPVRTAPTTTPTARTGTTAPVDRGRPLLGAEYRTLSNRLFGYVGEVAVANTGRAAATRWSVAVTLPAGAAVSSATGAEFTQDGRQVVFTGPAVAAGQTHRFEFEVTGDGRLGPKQPDGCAIDDDPCAGL